MCVCVCVCLCVCVRARVCVCACILPVLVALISGASVLVSSFKAVLVAQGLMPVHVLVALGLIPELVSQI